MRAYDRGIGRKGIGTDSYLLLLKTLEKGIGFNSEEQLKQVCTWLWQKPYHDREDFSKALEEAFNKYYLLFDQEEVLNLLDSKTLSSTRKVNKEITKSGPELESLKRKSKDNPLEKAEEKLEESHEETQKSIVISFENAQPDRDEASLQLEMGDLEKEIFKSSYILKGNYFELSSRKLQQRMRALRKMKKSADNQEICLEQTIEKAANQGFLERLEYKRGKTIETDLILLIDHGESMIAFEQFTEEIVNVTGLDFNLQNQVYYFSEAPFRYLFLDKEHKEAIKISDFIQGPKAPILIISDAGAAIGKVATERIEAITAFLQNMKHFKIAWLNPMPRRRWKRTAADIISYYVPMLDANAMEFGNVIKLFKSKIRTKTLI